jgi:hypothetical protein
MKRFIQFFSFIALAFVFSAVSAQAQSVTKVEAEIPFDFTIGEKQLSAGTYELRLVGNAGGGTRIMMVNKDGETAHSAIILRNGDAEGQAAKLVFDVVGGTRSLAAITTSDAGFSVPSTRKSKSVTIRASVPLKRAPERN